MASLALLFLLMPAALADQLQIGGSFNYANIVLDGDHRTLGGGSMDPSYLNGAPLDYLYCVDLNHSVNAPGQYDSAGVNTNGFVNGALVPNAARVAWLLGKYGKAPGTNEAALQAAIWKTIYDNKAATGHLVTFDAAWAHTATAQVYFDALGNNSGNVQDFLWLSPVATGGSQGLVGHVPDGGITLMLLGGALVGLEALRRRSRA
jgi:hypothetical protein